MSPPGLIVASALIDISQQKPADFKDKSQALKNRKALPPAHQGTCVWASFPLFSTPHLQGALLQQPAPGRPRDETWPLTISPSSPKKTCQKSHEHSTSSDLPRPPSLARRIRKTSSLTFWTTVGLQIKTCLLGKAQSDERTKRTKVSEWQTVALSVLPEGIPVLFKHFFCLSTSGILWC